MSNPIFSYTKRDYEGARQEGLAQIPILSNGVWTDLNASDPGIILLDYVHGLVDMIQYYQDHQALETFLTTSKERANIFRIAKQLCYKIISAKGAEVYVTFHSDFKYSYPIKIPQYTQVATNDHIIYMTKEDAYLPAGQQDVEVLSTQGELITMTYVGTGISRHSSMIEGAENQSILLDDQGIDIDSISIKDNLGRLWNSVDYITFTTDLDRAYEVDLNPDNTVTIKFGDGERGIIPQETDILTIQYIRTKTTEGRIGIGAIRHCLSAIHNDEGEVIEFQVTNKVSSTGGTAAQSSSSIRELAPGAIKAQDRAVTLRDFENLSKLVVGVANAKAYDINTLPDKCAYHVVKVLIVPDDTVTDTAILLKSVQEYLSSRMLPPTILEVFLPEEVPIDIDITVKKLDIYDASKIEYEIYQAIQKYFTDRFSEVSEDFYPTDLSTIVAGIEGVRYVTEMSPQSIVDISELSIARLGNVKITVQ